MERSARGSFSEALFCRHEVPCLPPSLTCPAVPRFSVPLASLGAGQLLAQEHGRETWQKSRSHQLRACWPSPWLCSGWPTWHPVLLVPGQQYREDRAPGGVGLWEMGHLLSQLSYCRLFKATSPRGEPQDGLYCIRNSSTKSGKVGSQGRCPGGHPVCKDPPTSDPRTAALGWGLLALHIPKLTGGYRTLQFVCRILPYTASYLAFQLSSILEVSAWQPPSPSVFGD